MVVDCVWNVMVHAQQPHFLFRRNGRVHLNRRGCQFSRLLAAEVGASAIVMLDTPCSEVVWRVLATHSIRKFPLRFPTCASPCAITFQLDSTPYSPDVTALGFRGTRYEYHGPNQQEQTIVYPYKIITASSNGNMMVNKQWHQSCGAPLRVGQDDGMLLGEKGGDRKRKDLFVYHIRCMAT